MHSSIHHVPERHRFEAELPGDGTAYLDYAEEGGLLVLTHTWVPPAARGRGVAAALVRRALEHARQQGVRVVPECPYVASFIGRHPAFRDLLA